MLEKGAEGEVRVKYELEDEKVPQNVRRLLRLSVLSPQPVFALAVSRSDSQSSSVMFRFLVIAMFIALTSAFMAPVAPRSMLSMSKVSMQVDEATRDASKEAWDGIWGFDRQKEVFLEWNPDAPRTYSNFNPFERNLDGAKADENGCFPGESRGYKSPNRPDVSWAIMQEEKLKLEELSKHPNWGLKGKAGCYSLKWQDSLGAPP